MRKNLKMFLVMCCVAALVLSGMGIPVASAANVDSLTAGSIFDSLGDAANYGIVAKDWYQHGHAESNACVDNVHKNSGDPFANSNNTYAHIYSSSVSATITAPSSLQGMTFALFREEGTGYALCAGTEQTVNESVSETTLSWNLDTALYNQQLHVFQVQDGSYVAAGDQNSAGLTVNYGPAVFAGANNGNYLGKIIFPNQKGRNESLNIFNMTNYYPSVVLGPETQLYEMVGNEIVPLDLENTSGSRTVYVNYYYPNPNNSDELLMEYIKLNDLKYTNGNFTRDNNIIYISQSEEKEPGYAADLVDNALDYSKQLANMGGGTIDPEKGLTPNPTGSSTVTGPVDAQGNVVSVYDVEVGSDWNLRWQDDMGIAALPVADNEYVIVNVICPSSGVNEAGERTGKLYLSRSDAGGLNYFIEGRNGKVQCGWGENAADKGASQRVIYNIVYADENGILQPYEGIIIPHSCHGGTILAPAARLETEAEVHNGAMIVDEVQNGQEIHQRVLGAKECTTWVIMDGGYLTLEKASLGYNWSVPPYGAWEDMSDKVDLSGAVFGVYSEESCSEASLVTKLETDATGKATSGLISAGTYWVKEIVPLKDHNLIEEPVQVTVTAGQTVQVKGGGYWVQTGYWQWQGEWIVPQEKFVNQQNNGYTSLRLLKHDEFGDVLQGAEFGVYRNYDRRTGVCSDLVCTAKTNHNGVAVLENVPLSYVEVTYYIQEITPPEGYKAGSNQPIQITLDQNDRDKIITIDGNGNAEGIAFTNTIIRGNMALKKVDAKTNANLEGAEFTIYSDKECTQVVGVMTTKRGGDADSRQVIEGKDGLIPGVYYVMETKAPEGYMLDSTVHTVKVLSGKMVDVVTGNEIARAPEATPIGNAQGLNIFGNKVWFDEGFENNRPREVKIELYKNGKWLRDVTVSEQTDWKFEFLNLPRYDENGEEIVYTIKENLYGKSYDYYAYLESIDKTGNANVTVANSIRKTDIEGVKVWEDKVGYDPDRPDSITYYLYQQVGDELVPMLDDQDQPMTYTGHAWEQYRFRFLHLPTYAADGTVAVYVVKEAESEKYEEVDSTSTSREEQGNTYVQITLTNRLTVSLQGAKVWQDSSNADGTRPENVTLTVYRNGMRMRPQPAIVWDKETDTDVWQWKVTGLPKYDENDQLYSYTVKEEQVLTGYVGTTSEDGLTFYNTKPGALRLYKVYVDENGAYQSLNGAEFKLYYDAQCQQPVSDTVYTTAQTGPTRNGFIEITNLVPGDYYIREEKAPNGFRLPVPNDPILVTVVAGQTARVNGEHGVVVNEPGDKTVSVSVSKAWVGDEGLEAARPASVTIQLFQNGAAMVGKTLELSAANEWRGEFTDLPAADASGVDYVYTVDETVVVPGYDGTVTGDAVNGFTVTNTLQVGGFRFVKQDEGGHVLPGAVFGVYSDEGCTAPVTELIAGDDGVVFMTGIPAGTTYYIKESIAPEGYVLNGTVYSVTIEAGVDDKPVGDNGVIVNDPAQTQATFAFLKWINNYGGGELPVLDFVFNIEPVGEYDDTMLAFKGGYPVDEAFTVTVKGDKSSEEIRTEFELTIWKAGTYQFRISEKIDDVPDGWDFTAEDFTVSIPVTEQADGSLTVGDVTYDDFYMDPTFLNNYFGDTFFSAYKQWTKYNGETDITLKLYYRQEIVQPDGTTTYTPWAEYTGDYEVELEKPEAEQGQEVTWWIRIDNLPYFVDNKVMRYGVVEISPDAGYTVTYKDVSGNLITEDENGLRILPFGGTIVNELYEADGKITFAGTKTIDTRALTANDVFTFEIQEGDTVIATVQNDATGKIAYPTISYTLADVGDHTYTIRETSTDGNGITVDTNVYTVTVTVADAGDGTLSVTASDNATALDFTNIYAADGEIVFSGSKTLTGKTLSADEYSFELIGADGTVIETVKNGADGKFVFSAIKYELSDIGEHVYTVKEVNDGKAGITYDETVYTVTVTVSDKGDGTLVATASDNATKLDFTNTYDATGAVQLKGTKTLTGKELEAGMFSFELLDADGNVLETVQNAADGSFTFTEIGYTLSDAGQTYTYKVREAAGDSEGMIYDATVYTVKVGITDNGDGTLTAEPVITRLGQVVGEIIFNNIMEAPLTITKKVVGCETEEPFAFVIYFYHADGTEVTEPVAYTGDVTGEIISGDLVLLTHGQSITFNGLLPGMRYTVEELANDAFETTVNALPMTRVDGTCEEGGNRADFVNKLKTTTFSVTKSWQGAYGGEIILTLYANGEKMDPQPLYFREGDTYIYTDLPMYNADGELVVYSAKERYMDGYLTIYDNVSPYDGETKMIYDGGTIINRAVTSLRVRKLWSGLPEDTEMPMITLTLYCNGEPMDRKQPTPDEEGWYVYKNLPRYVGGEEAFYYVVEDAMDGFIPLYTDLNGEPADWAENGFTITNALVPATGDNSPLVLWAVMLTASAALLLFMLKRRRKEN